LLDNLSFSADFRETLERILERHRIRTIFKPIIKLSAVLALGKDSVPASKRRGVVYEILWIQIHWRNETKPEYSTERTPQRHLT